MSNEPVTTMTFEQLRAEIAAQPIGDSSPRPGADSARIDEVREEIRRRGGAPVPSTSAGLEEAPVDPNAPTNSA